jgi:hypothetical protein
MNNKLHLFKMYPKFLYAALCGLFICFASLSSATAGCTLSVKITHTDNKCHGDSSGSATATPIGGVKPFNYLWSPVGGTGATASKLTAGLYIVTVTDSNGCIAKDSVTINQPVAINLSITSFPYTCGKNEGSATASASGGVSPYAYSWAPTGTTGATVNNLSAGTYTCTVTDSNNCAVVKSTVITGTGGPVIHFGGRPDSGSCDGVDTAVVSNGTAPYSYSWSPGGATTQVITGLCAGKYCCIVTDALGCKDTSCSTVSTITGIDKLKHSWGIKVYPIPANNILFINSNNNKLEGSTIEVYDVTGREIVTQKITENSIPYSLDVSALNNGVYMLRITLGDEVKISRFTIAR